VRGLHLEVREALTIVDFEEDHQLVIWVGRPRSGHRDSSPNLRGIRTPWQPSASSHSSSSILPHRHHGTSKRKKWIHPKPHLNSQDRPYLWSSSQLSASTPASPTIGALHPVGKLTNYARSGQEGSTPSSKTSFLRGSMTKI
jgi:hypothetical protein